ncbi:hypothetical protein [Rhodoferax sediminis]|uniref:PXPV repeat-containing protein n=1 Tax=Rhodoferax sediminis TaxID=2509614 RepID=A0A515D7R0_9BURK|nr:hypothetical protein [Rhodoferax sediminis]QDL36454.1 hypothetical protein EUB48_03435 [Rhodoferax sediminis]
MSPNRSTLVKWAAAGTVAVGALFTVASANAEVNWSVGVSVPGVAVGVLNPPVYYMPAPVYAAPPPVYYQPAPRVYYRPPPVYYRPAPVYYGPPTPVYYGPGYGYRHYDRRDWDDHDDQD